MTYYSDDFFSMQSPNDYFIVVVIMDMIFLSTTMTKIPRGFLEFMPNNSLPLLTETYVNCYNYLFDVGGTPPCLGCYLHEEYVDRFILINKSFENIQKYLSIQRQTERLQELRFMKEFIISILYRYHRAVSEICHLHKIKCPSPVIDSDIEKTIQHLQNFIKKNKNLKNNSDLFFPTLMSP